MFFVNNEFLFNKKALSLLSDTHSTRIMGRFINPFTDYGFKFLFGREVEKELFRLDAVYGVFFMNFVMDKDMPATIRTDVVLSDRATGKLFNDKFRQIFIELPNFNKEEDECNTDFERWIYILKHMDTLDRMPFKARKAVFERLEKLASKANMTQEERAQYEEEWKVYNDYFNTLDFAEKKGMQKGMQKEKEVTARIMKSKGLSLELISECTGLTTEEIEKLE